MKVKLYFSKALNKEPEVIGDVKDYYITEEKGERFLCVELNSGEKKMYYTYAVARTEKVEE
jgi:hypothetical protein